MKKIVIDGAIFGFENAGGNSRFWAEVLLGLDQEFAASHPLHLLMPPNTNVEWERIRSHLRYIKVEKRRPIVQKSKGYLRESLYLTRIALKLRPWVWHASHYVGLPLKFYMHIVHSFYDMIPEVLGVASKDETYLKYRCLKGADTILSISNHSKRDLTSIWPHFSQKTRVIHLSAGHENDEKECQKFDVPHPYFLFIGKRGGYKNFLTILEQLLPDSRFSLYHIVVVGGRGGFSSEEEDRIEELRGEERVHYVGTLPQKEVNFLIKGASALLYPSIYEGFGLPVLEAFMHRVPILACNCSSIPEITGKKYPLADPNDPTTFSSVLAELLNDKERWVTHGDERKKHFSHQKMINAIRDVYTMRK
ncbi:MAG: glycosyltransferase family 4 protein [Chlamydiia bacterium]|nr:glycosyltransferase family 4 protein [Chlamydiia bacterium]